MMQMRAHLLSTTLIALPFLLLAGIWLVPAEQWYAAVFPVDPWWAMRWLLRGLYIGGAVLGWRAGRPRWFYTWLGFAVYEAVAILLWPNFFLWSAVVSEPLFFFLALVTLPLAFVPYFVVILWMGWPRTQRLLAAYTIFPHAALMVPLFIFVDVQEMQIFSSVFGLASVLPALATAAIAIVFWYPPGFFRRQESIWRGILLFGGAALVQLLSLASFLVADPFADGLLFLVVPLICLSWVILSGPLLLPALIQWLLRILRSAQFIVRRGAEEEGRARGPLFALTSFTVRIRDSVQTNLRLQDRSPKGDTMSESTSATEAAVPTPQQSVGPGLERAYKLSIVALIILAVLAVILYIGRAAVYKIHEFERGLHLRGGRFLSVQMPGWHAQIPLVDTVIVVKVNERLGYVERIPAMTSDNVTMDISLQFTYRVTNPERFALAVDDPERIVFEFVQGRLRDVINTKAMTGVMNQRATMNLEIMQELKEKEEQYGVEFMTVQIQGASPPVEVLAAIKDRMVAVQRQEQAEAEAAQQRTAADAKLYAAQKEAEAQAYQITTTAAAEAEQIQVTTEAQQLAVRAILSELEGKGPLAEKYIEYMIAAELKENSKWILGSGPATPLVDLRAPVGE